MISLGQAARLAGVGKTTITRAIQSGKLSATRRADGGYEIDPAELSRVYTIRVEGTETVPVVHRATPPRLDETPSLETRLAILEEEIKGLKGLLDEVKQSREDWKEQVGRLTNALPDLRGKSEAAPERPRSWWRRMVG